MAPIVSTVDIDRPPGEVFAFATDPRHFADWQTDILDARYDDDGNGPPGRPPGPGARFTTVRRIRGSEQKMTQEIVETDPPRTWAAHAVSGPIRPQVRITVEPLDGGARARLTFSLDFEGHGAGVALVPAIRRIAAKSSAASYQRLKERLEEVGG